MKSRQKFTVSEKGYFKSTESGTESSLEKRANSKISCNPLLQKNLGFLQTYNNLFRKPTYQIGDAETFFRNSLRNEKFDLIRDLNLQRHFVKSVKSFESINKRKVRTRTTLLSPSKAEFKRLSDSDLILGKDDYVVKEIYSSEQKEQSESETESEKEYYSPENESDKEYFSPKDEYLVDLLEVEEVSEGTSPKAAEDDLNERLDEILKTEEDTMAEGFEAGMEGEYPGGEDDTMKEVEQMIQQASTELQQVVEENQQLMEAIDGKPGDKDGGDGSVFKFDPAIDAAVLKELEDAERQAMETAKIINELKARVAELLQKEKMTEVEAKELEEKNKELKAQMILFEEKTKRIQFLIGQSNLFESMLPMRPMLQTKNKEDMLPKVIVCGLTENNMPKLIVCGGKARSCSRSPRPNADPECQPPAPEGNLAPVQGAPPSMPPMLPPQLAKKLNECYCMQEKLATENADLEGMRYKLQADLMNKDQTVDNLQRQVCCLQTEMRMVATENKQLTEQLQSCMAPCANQNNMSRPVITCGPQGVQSSQDQPQGMQCGKGRGICPADIASRLQEYSQNTQNLERQLGDMEQDMKCMQRELLAVQKEREHLEHHRKMMCVPPPPPPCYRPPCPPPPCAGAPPCFPPPCAPPPCCGPSPEQQLRELREQYNRLQDDFKGKLTEVAGLRADNERLKENAKAAEAAKKAAEDKMKELEQELKKLKEDLKGPKPGSTKEQLIDLEQQLIVAKQRFREAQDELEELRALVTDQQEQLDDYRNKYLEAQQLVEEQRRAIDLMELDNQRTSEQVNLEIQRVKNQFQEKLQELMPLPDILKSTQLKLQEAQQMHLLAERNNEAIARELQMYKDKIAAMANQMDEVRSDQQLGADEKATLDQKIADLEQRLLQLQEENEQLIRALDELQEKIDESEKLAEERLHEITQLETQLESVREETARQIARTKDRCEIVRRSMQNQISDLERQLAQSRALAKAAQKDRDDIRQKMQAQINNLNENFDDAQMRIRNLQGHVNFLKNTYGNAFPPDEPAKTPKELPEPCNCGADY